MDVDVSIDKCSFMCDVDCEPYEWLSGHGGFDDTAVWSAYDLESNRRTVSFRVGTIYVSAQVMWAPAQSDRAMYWAKEQPVRIEYNPNKVDAWALSLVYSGLKNIRPTRFDVALDYPGVQLGEWSFRRKGTKAAYFTARGGEPEGFYLGSPSSLVVFRTYDKLRELIAKTKKASRDAEEVRLNQMLPTGLARVECVSRLRPAYKDRCATESMPLDLFDRLDAVRRFVPYDGLTPYECGLLALYHYEPDVLRSLHKDPRSRARELALQRCGSLAPGPAEAYRARRADLKEWALMLSQGQVVPVAQVYRRNDEAPE